MVASGCDWRDSLLAIVCSVMPAGYPLVRPYKMLDFANNQIIDSDFVFSRSTTATFVNASGVLTTAGVDTLRPSYDPYTGQYLGVLFEYGSTNLLPWSNNIAHPSWYYAPQNAPLQSGFIGVGNQPTAFRIGEGTIPGSWELATSIALGSGSTTAVSAFVKSDGVSKGFLQFLGVNNSGVIVGNLATFFDLSRGEIYPENYGTNALAAKMERRINGWFRAGVIGNIPSTATLGVLLLKLQNDDNSLFYLGRERGLLVDGFQVERGVSSPKASAISSFIFTSGVALTRATDQLRSDGARLGQWYVQSSGTFYQEAITDEADWFGEGRGYLLATNTSTGARAELRYGMPGPKIIGVVGSGSSVDYTASYVGGGNGLNSWESPASGTGTSHPIYGHSAFVFSNSGLNVFYNGQAVASNALGLVPSGVNRVDISPQAGGVFTLRRCAFYPPLSTEQASLITQT